ncbi:unnamed protein product, partial [marine sediment metagenome]
MLVGALAILVSLHTSQIVLNETKSRVAVDLRVAHKFLDKEIEKSVITLELVAEKQRLIDPLEKSQPIPADVRAWLEKKRVDSGFDFLTLCNEKGKVILRTRFPYNKGDFSFSNGIVSGALQRKSASGIVIIPSQALKMEGEDLLQQAYIKFMPTPQAKPRSEKAETSGMALMAAVPVWTRDERIIGVLYGGTLLNRNYQLVDYVRDMVLK